MEKWNLKDEMLTSIKKEGGFVNCHAHFDKAYYIDKEGLDKTMVDMEAKWNMSDDIKRSSTQEEIEQRIRWALDTLVEQGCKLTASFIDAYQAVGHKAIDAANVVKEEYKDKIEFLTITQPLGGLNDSEARKLYEETDFSLAAGHISAGIFQDCWNLRGMEQFFLDIQLKASP